MSDLFRVIKILYIDSKVIKINRRFIGKARLNSYTYARFRRRYRKYLILHSIKNDLLFTFKIFIRFALLPLYLIGMFVNSVDYLLGKIDSFCEYGRYH